MLELGKCWRDVQWRRARSRMVVVNNRNSGYGVAADVDADALQILDV